MRNVWNYVLGVAVVALGIWLWLFFFPSPEKVITRQFEKMAHAISVRPGEGYLPRMAGAQTVGDFFSTNVELNIDVPHYRQHSTLSRDDIVQGIMAANLSSGLTVKFADINVSVSADKANAQAEMTVEAKVPGEQDQTFQEMKFTLRKINGKWLIVKAQTVRPLS